MELAPQAEGGSGEVVLSRGIPPLSLDCGLVRGVFRDEWWSFTRPLVLKRVQATQRGLSLRVC